MSTVKTEFGDVSIDELVRVYCVHKKANLRHQAHRHLFNQTERGKQLNRERAKNYYYTHRNEILQLRREQNQMKKEELETYNSSFSENGQTDSPNDS